MRRNSACARAFAGRPIRSRSLSGRWTRAGCELLIYPKAGEQNPGCRIGVVKIEGEVGETDSDGDDIEKNRRSKDASGAGTPKINWIHVPGDPRHHYIASLDWIPGSDELVFQR